MLSHQIFKKEKVLVCLYFLMKHEVHEVEQNAEL